jgi:uncharacterized protein
MPTFKTKLLASIADVERAEWNRLLTTGSTPFVDHRFLSALEGSGCASEEAGWTPSHLAAYRDGKLIAAAPAYIKQDSDGDFARDWDLGSAASRAHMAYYPKLVLGVPFTPCTGERLLTARELSSTDAKAARFALIEAGRELCRSERLGTLQVLFSNDAEAGDLTQLGLAHRLSFQFHWQNEGYRDYADFLSRFTSKRRAMLKREAAAPEKQGISIRTLRGDEITKDPIGTARVAHHFHATTVRKLMWGRGWLNCAFYEAVFTTMPEHVELVWAEKADRPGKPIAGAFNIRGGQRLYGRYWGCLEDHPFLHFNVCYYHSIQECIARGVQVFEGGAGGEHKLSRGFLPSETHSLHLFFDPRVDVALRDHLRRETPERESALVRWRAEASGYRAANAGEIGS